MRRPSPLKIQKDLITHTDGFLLHPFAHNFSRLFLLLQPGTKQGISSLRRLHIPGWRVGKEGGLLLWLLRRCLRPWSWEWEKDLKLLFRGDLISEALGQGDPNTNCFACGLVFVTCPCSESLHKLTLIILDRMHLRFPRDSLDGLELHLQ